MKENRKPGWMFWTVVALLMVLAYPVSFGPAVWIAIKIRDRPGAPTKCRMPVAIEVIYYPLRRLSVVTEGTRFERIGNWTQTYEEWWFDLTHD